MKEEWEVSILLALFLLFLRGYFTTEERRTQSYYEQPFYIAS